MTTTCLISRSDHRLALLLGVCPQKKHTHGFWAFLARSRILVFKWSFMDRCLRPWEHCFILDSAHGLIPRSQSLFAKWKESLSWGCQMSLKTPLWRNFNVHNCIACRCIERILWCGWVKRIQSRLTSSGRSYSDGALAAQTNSYLPSRLLATKILWHLLESLPLKPEDFLNGRRNVSA